MLKKIEIFKKLKPAFLVLDKNSLSYWDEANSLKLDLPKELVSDLEVLDEGKLTETISSFITNNKLTPKNILLVLNAHLFFEKTFKDQVDIEAQTKKFLENVPFENISSRLINDGENTKLLVTNKNFFLPVKNAFEAEGFKVNLVLPYLTLEKNKFEVNEAPRANARGIFSALRRSEIPPKQNSSPPSTVLQSWFSAKADKKIDKKTIKELNQKLKLLRQDNLLVEATGPKPKKENKASLIKVLKIKNSRLTVLLSVLLVLIFILIGLLISQNPSINPPKKAPVIGKVILSPTPSPGNPAASEKTLENTALEIFHSDKNLKTANLFKNQLVLQGFKNITIASSSGQSNTPKTFVVFSLKIPEALKEKIVTLVNKTFIDVTIQESNVTEADVLITVGQTK